MRTGTKVQRRNNPYQNRAEEIRTIAEGLKDLECRAMLCRLAETYEQLARWQEQNPTFRAH